MRPAIGRRKTRAALFTDPSQPILAAPGKVEVEMVVVRSIVNRAEHCCEIFAAALAHVAQERPLSRRPIPTALKRNFLTVDQAKTGHIECVGVAVFGKLAAAFVIDRPTGV